MKAKTINRFIPILVLSLLFQLMTGTVFARTAVSPALSVLEHQLSVVMTSASPDGIAFTAEDFDDAVGAGHIDGITVTSLPNVTQGVLWLGNVAVMKNQTIARANLDLLRFVPTGDTAQTSFGYISLSDCGNHTLTCRLFVLDHENAAPDTSCIAPAYTTVNACENITYYGVMSASDPNGDSLTYEVVTRPEHGMLTGSALSLGSYCYTPDEDYCGFDCFQYIARDCYGAVSDPITVSVTVLEQENTDVFCDMTDHWAATAAVRVAQKGLMTGELSTESDIANPTSRPSFDPDAAISRLDFLTLTMQAAGFDIGSVSAAQCGFCDNASVPFEKRGAVALAAQLGMIHGTPTEAGLAFEPDRPISRAEAAVILCRMLSPSLSSDENAYRCTFADETGIPEWAEDAVYTMNRAGILRGTGDGCIAPGQAVTRAQTAQILCALIDRLI